MVLVNYRFLLFYLFVLFRSAYTLETHEYLAISVLADGLTKHAQLIAESLKVTVASSLALKPSDVYLSYTILSNPLMLSYKIELHTAENAVIDSFETPETYKFWKPLWCDKVAAMQTVMIETPDSGKVALSVQPKCTYSLSPIEIDENDYFTNRLKLSTPSGGYALIDHIQNNVHNTLSARMTQKQQFFAQSYQTLDAVFNGISQAASEILLVPQSYIHITEIVPDDTGVVFRFIVYPLESRTEIFYVTMWGSAVRSQDPRIRSKLPYMDFSYSPSSPQENTVKPPTIDYEAITEQSLIYTPITNAEKSSGVIIGSVVGSAVGLVILATAAYLIKKKAYSKSSTNDDVRDEELEEDEIYTSQ